ncbi:uncharacterized protein [Amphiura filiformis]|uniref:uncharacterized protein n=1 Tax=Amphiura filiformis TaxID=82378 RepID=UPI003B2178E2
MASNKFKQTPNSTIPTKRVKLSHESSSQGKDSVADGETMRNISNRPSAKTKVKDNTSHKEKTIVLTSEGKGVKKPITDVKTSVEDQEPNTSHNTTTNGKYTKVDAPPQLELLGGQPLSPKCRDTMPKLKVYDELKELQDLLDGTFKSDQEQVDGDLRPADVENADDLKERILKMSDYPRVIVKRFPLPEGFEFNIKDLFVDVSSLSPVSAQKSKPASSKQIDTKSNNNDIKPIENVKENVPSMSFEEVDEEISIKVSGDENRILEGKETEMDSVTEIPPPSSDTKSSVPEEPLCNQNIKEKPKCANCETHVRHILNITNQLNVLKRRIQRFIGSHNENIITNQKLSYQLKIAREQNKKLESQNAVYRTTIQSIGTNTGQLVKTSDGRFYRLTPKTHAVNQSIPQITAGNQLSQILSGSVAPNQRPIVHSVGNMVQQQQPQQKTFNLVPSQDPSKPGQVILELSHQIRL